MLPSFALSFFASFVLAGIILEATIFAAKRYRLFPRKRLRDAHHGNVSRLGGVALFCSFWIIFFLHPLLALSPLLWGLFAASLILFTGSLLDDTKERSWVFQLFFQIAALIPLILAGMTIAFIRNPFGGTITLPGVLGIAAASLWILFTINAFNWLDGLDGLASGVGLMAVGALFFLSLTREVNQPPLAIINAIMAGSLLALFMASIPPAKIFLGTTGALFLGLFLGTQTVIAGTKLATLSLVLAPFFLDAIWVIAMRLKQGASPFKPDLLHLHFRLLEKGFKKRTILFLYLAASGFLGILALLLNTQEKLVVFLLLIVLFSATRLTLLPLDVFKK